MSYPGNASLAAAVKDRVLSTFQQTLALYKQGRTEEVAAGCGLILQMDPSFDPARKLLEKSRNPALPIDVDQLLPAERRSLIDQARDAMAAGEYQRVMQLANEILTEDLLNDEARVLAEQAQEKLEAAPFIEQFTRRSEQSLASGNVAAAKLELEKARSLDAAHPDVARVAALIAAREGAPAAGGSTPSFVVDDRAGAPPARSAAQASDFGFTFEEEKPAEAPFAEFSFDSPAQKDQGFAGFSFGTPSTESSFSFGEPQPPAAPAPAPHAPAEFDFTTASVVSNDDDQKKIDQFLAEGDRAFAAGEYQQAIDFWSRIFLIDVTNDLASERIERAKAKRREIDQKIESILASGIAAFERGDTAKAHADLSEVLRLDPHNAGAQEYLDRLAETLPSRGAAPAARIDADDSFDENLFGEEMPAGSFEPPLVPPDPGATPPVPQTKSKPGKAKSSTKAARPAGRKLPMTAILAVVGVLVLGIGGWAAWQWASAGEEQTDSAASEATLARATTLAGSGQYDKAIALLREVQPGDPLHDRALVMIADLQQKKSTSAQLIDGVPAEQYFEQQIAAARTAFEAHDYVGAKTAFDQAARAKPLPPDLKAMYDTASQQAAKLDSAKALFGERRYDEAIANLQPLLEQDPENQNIRRLIVDAHFNLGAVALQEERTADAIRQFDEVLKVQPEDELARRSRDLASRYDGEPKDLLYKIYVKYLPLRRAT